MTGWCLWITLAAAPSAAVAAFFLGRRVGARRAPASPDREAPEDQLEAVNALLNREIERRDRSEREKARVIAELEARNAEMERFTYTVSHDLKSPLVTIRGFLGALKKDLAEGRLDRADGDIGRIDRASARMARLLEELLQLSRVGRLVNPARVVSLGEVAKEAVELLAGPLAESGVRVEIAPDLPLAYGDRTRLLELFQNLVENAVRFMGDQPDPLVEIGCRRNGDTPVCFVRDNGIGIDPRYHEKIFELFERLDADREGTGIGLALVHRIVELHGGRVWVESDGPGHGSTFYFTLPRRE